MSSTMAEAVAPEIMVEPADEVAPSQRLSQDQGTDAKAKSQFLSECEVLLQQFDWAR